MVHRSVTIPVFLELYKPYDFVILSEASAESKDLRTDFSTVPDPNTKIPRLRSE